MEHPLLNVIQQKEELITNFTGYNHTLTATEGSYFDMKNMSSDYYPAMSPRKKRCKEHTFTNFQGMINRNGTNGIGLVWVDNGELYIDGTKKTGISFTVQGMKTIVSMGAYLVFFPDNKWYNTKDDTYGNLDATKNMYGEFNWGYARDDGTIITGIDLITPTPQDGDYKSELVNGKPAIYQYSALTQTWNPVTPIYTYIQSYTNGFFSDFKEGDGVKLTFEPQYLSTYEKDNIYINEETNGCKSAVLTIVKKPDNQTIVIPVDSGINTLREITPPTHIYPPPAGGNKEDTIKRIVPSMSFVIECQNRLWGCSSDGHEVYASKLGDPTNWNVFQGISTDSWAATVGSNGAFTGAIAYQGNPIFFKEDSMLRITISSVGGHQYRETLNFKGVSSLASNSLAIVNNILYYKSRKCICAFDGSYPVEISSALGNIEYSYGVAGGVGNKYYICLHDYPKYELFVYDTKYGMWVKEDDVNVRQFSLGISSVQLYFVKGEELFVIDQESASLPSETLEGAIEWFIESNNIGYLYTGKSYRSRINKKQYIQKMIMQVSLAVGSHISVYINYDSSDEWEFLYNFSGSNANLCKIPIRPHRCNHFRYKIVGHGDAKIYSITKYYTEGSDV